MVESADLDLFVRGEVDARGFSHSEHVRMAFELLGRHDFAQSALYYSSALRAMTARVGKPEAFHQTLTIAFLAMIAERTFGYTYPDFAAFATANPDIMHRPQWRVL